MRVRWSTHANGLVHRDLKPSNILVERAATSSGAAADGGVVRLGGRPKILDFGVARCADLQTVTEAESGHLIGTIPYMSPEQATGGRVDARSDDAGGTPGCAIRDGSSSARLSDASIAAGGMLVLEFTPPITAFYSMFGSLSEGATAIEKLYFGNVPVGISVSTPSMHKSHSPGHGFASATPIDRIEITTNDSGVRLGRGALLGAFGHVLAGEASLGTVRIADYRGPAGDDVQLDFACVFDDRGR